MTPVVGVPVPETLIESGLVEALLVMVILPENPPADDGVKRRVSAKDCPGGTVRVTGLAENTPLLGVNADILRVSVPVFVTVTVVSLNWPTFTLPKLIVDRLSTSATLRKPVPETLMESGLVAALLVIRIRPEDPPKYSNCACRGA